MRKLLFAAFLLSTALILPLGASAQDKETRPATISVSATGSVDYVPDIARMQLGVRAQASTAAAAADMVNRIAAQIVAAVERQGISPRAIQTSGYNLEYREPQPPSPAPGVQSTAAIAGTYVASEILVVTASVKSAGAVLDAGINAGANTSYGMSYQSSNADALYRQALAKAITAARESAQAMASAAHVTLVRILSLSNTQEQAIGAIPMEMARAAAPVLPGTDTMTATVYAVYLIK